LEETQEETGTEEFINPMAAMSFGAPSGPSDYKPVASRPPVIEDEEEDDLGFGNSSLSRGRTPKPPVEGGKSGEEVKPVKEETKEPAPSEPPAKGECWVDFFETDCAGEQKGSWLGRWWGKKEGEGPVRAKLGEESSMVYDKELKRWVVKGVSGYGGRWSLVLTFSPNRKLHRRPRLPHLELRRLRLLRWPDRTWGLEPCRRRRLLHRSAGMPLLARRLDQALRVSARCQMDRLDGTSRR
jgi:hypothetical protein